MYKSALEDQGESGSRLIWSISPVVQEKKWTPTGRAESRGLHVTRFLLKYRSRFGNECQVYDKHTVYPALRVNQSVSWMGAKRAKWPVLSGENTEEEINKRTKKYHSESIKNYLTIINTNTPHRSWITPTFLNHDQYSVPETTLMNKIKS
ncbi:uncharacterized [Tachysurus ichikawai]